MNNDSNIYVDKTKTKLINLSFTNTVSGLPLDLTGGTIYLTVKKKYTQTDLEANLQKIVTLHSDPLNGLTSIEIEPSDTENFNIGSYFYDIQLTDASGKKYILLKGNFFIRDVITQS